MEYDCQIDIDIERKFEVYDIKWVIENFSLVTCADSWSVKSPVFSVSGFHVTKWLISLATSTNKHLSDSVVFTLMRCDDTGPESVCVEWTASISVSQKGEKITLERLCDFSMGAEYKENLKGLRNRIATIKSFDSDLMTIECKMIVYNRAANNEFPPCPDRAKNCLSENLLNMFLTGQDYDLQLKIGDKSILAHKAIVCTRIEELNHLLESAETVSGGFREIDVIDLSNLNHEAVMKILEYMYSGNLIHVLGEPSLAILDTVQFLDMYHLKQFYAAKKLHFRTSLNAQETRFTWIIADFFDEYDNSLVSPDLLDDLSTTWRLHIFPAKISCSDYYSVYAENVGVNILGNLCIEFAITDEYGQSVFSRLLRRAEDDFRPLRVDKFIRRSTLRSLMIGNTLRLTLKVKLSQDSPSSWVEKQDITIVTNSRKTDSFDLLSREMQDLFELSDFSDILVRSSDESYAVHRSILSARCSFLSNLLNNMNSEANCVIIEDIEHDILYLLLNYIYGGVVLQIEDTRKVTKLRDAAALFKLPLLSELCEDALKTTGD